MYVRPQSNTLPAGPLQFSNHAYIRMTVHLKEALMIIFMSCLD